MENSMQRWLTPDRADLIFRILFSLIFLGLGFEHLFSDTLLQQLMPLWLPAKRLLSILSGVLLLTGGSMILLGYRIRLAAILLGIFIIFVTMGIHFPALFYTPAFVPPEARWLWAIYQRSNFAKNLCLLGVCFYLYYHVPGIYSIDALRQRKISQQ